MISDSGQLYLMLMFSFFAVAIAIFPDTQAMVSFHELRGMEWLAFVSMEMTFLR